MPGSPDSRPHTFVLPTGWRVTGRGAATIAERAANYASERVEPGRVADTLFAVQCTVPPTIRGRQAAELLLDHVTDEIRQAMPDCPRLVRDEKASLPPSRFGGMHFESLTEPGEGWIGEVVWRTVHPMILGQPITTRLLIEERHGYTRLNVRVTADNGFGSVRNVGAGQVKPAFLHALRSSATPTWLGAPVEPTEVGPGQVEDFVVSVLSSEARDYPVALLTPLEDGTFVVDPEDLAWDLLGRAKLYVIRDHALTFELTDTVGDRRMSCFLGAVRAYYPGWSRHDDPYDHPLLVAGRLADPMDRSAWMGDLGVWLGTRVALPPSIAERRATSSPEAAGAPSSAVSGGRARGAAEVPAGTRGATTAAPELVAPAGDASHPVADSAATVTGAVGQPLPDPTPFLNDLIAEVRALHSLVRSLADEVERLRVISAVRASSTSAIERRMGRLEEILEEAFPDGTKRPVYAAGGETREPEYAADEAGRFTLVDAVNAAAEVYSDALLFLDSAIASAAESPYEDPERVRTIFDAMARIARRRRDGELGMSLRDAFADLGIDYRPGIARSTPEKLRAQYRFYMPNGTPVEAVEHIALGNTYDPRRCLRIYFSSRISNDPRLVIAHVGRHFEVITST